MISSAYSFLREPTTSLQSQFSQYIELFTSENPATWGTGELTIDQEIPFVGGTLLNMYYLTFEDI